jgi:hypothetical protein
MRILRGFIGCWLGLVVSLYLTVFMPSPGSSSLLPNLAAAATLIAFVPTIVLGIFEKSSSPPAWYLLVAVGMSICALGATIAASGPLPDLHDARQVSELLLAFGCACFVGVTTGGAYRLLAGAKSE